MNPLLTLGTNWVDQYISGMMLLHAILGYDAAVRPRAVITPAILVQVLQEIATNNYVPSRYFESGGNARTSFTLEAPTLAPNGHYLLVALNASTATGQFVSVDNGGILFEDPVWAILAAHALSKHLSVALPQSTDNQQLWHNVSRVAGAVKQGTYRPEDFLAPFDGAVPAGAPLSFELITVESNRLEQLRRRGLQSIPAGGSLKLFELFDKP